ncbi:hypothetical protein CDV31_009130 [Fusarium ambrosium]|uniref:Uncharacterized protein n=1 Tax=Fusarium ambrosium TaxID=131363 RepID=A0A428TWK7_9HYPO|nr:hypothetical protein CDV31_009130 [Fusarium ambrosium]
MDDYSRSRPRAAPPHMERKTEPYANLRITLLEWRTDEDKPPDGLKVNRGDDFKTSLFCAPSNHIAGRNTTLQKSCLVPGNIKKLVASDVEEILSEHRGTVGIH